MNAMARKPSTAWYRVAAITALVGVIGAVGWGLTTFLSIGDRVAGFPRSSVPGQLIASIDAGKTYAVFYEAEDTDSMPALDVRVTDPAGTAVAVNQFVADLRYDHDGTVSRAVASFEPVASGYYVVMMSGDVPGAATFSVGPSMVTGVASVVGAVVLLFASVGVGLVIAVATLVLRNRSVAQWPAAPSIPKTPAGVA